MKEGQTSRTAEYMALFRALESSEAPARRLFEDRFAAAFLPPRFHLVVSLSRLPLVGAIVRTYIGSAELQPILASLGLKSQDLVTGISAQVISTGLPYLILPVHPEALARAEIRGSDLEVLLAALGAKFVLVLEVGGRELRTWDNLGRVEDVATGSAAGPAAAYLFSLGIADPNLPMELAQGRFAGRPSKIRISRDSLNRLLVSGEVWPVAHGFFDLNATQVGF